MCLVVGLALVAAMPSSALPTSGALASGAQAFSARGDVVDLERDAIAVHALIEYVFASHWITVAASSNGPVVAVVPAAAPTAAPAAPTAAVPSPVEPVTTAPAAPDHVSRGHLALARVPVSPSSVGFTIEFLPGRAGYGGLTYPDSRRIEIYVDSGWNDAYLAHVVAHEIGHAVDMARNSRTDHERWRAARGIPASTRWWADPYTSDFATPGGDFAECFAAWAVGTVSTRSEFGSCAGTGPLIRELVWG